MLNEGVDVHNMMEGNFDFKQFEVPMNSLEGTCELSPLRVCACVSQGRLDISKAAIMGHSFGGATTIQALSEDQRFL